jgi:hypothetical protein
MLYLLLLLSFLCLGAAFVPRLSNVGQLSRRSTNLKMLCIETEEVSIQTPTGPMRTIIMQPAAPGKYPGVVFFSEIFQITGPIMRSAAMIAGE